MKKIIFYLTLLFSTQVYSRFFCPQLKISGDTDVRYKETDNDANEYWYDLDYSRA